MNPSSSIIYPTEVESLHKQLAAANTLIQNYREETTLLRQQLSDSQQALRNVYEVWPGSENLPRATAVFDSYLLSVIDQMRDAAKDGMK